MNKNIEKNYYTHKCLAACASRERQVEAPSSLALCSSLNDYALYFGTDKSSRLHGICEYYALALTKFKSKKFTLIEFGIRDGASLNMWGAYFPNATIIGIDPNAASVKQASDNIKIFTMDAFDYKAIKPVLIEYPPSVIIDDATHYWSHQINAFEEYFPYLKADGLYIVEDIETSFGDFRKGVWADQSVDAVSYFLNLASSLAGSTSQGIHPSNTPVNLELLEKIASVSFIKDVVLIYKKLA